MKIPKEALDLFNKARENIDKRNYKEGLDPLNKALAIEPNYAEAMSLLSFAHYGLKYQHLGQGEAFNLAQKALKLNSKSPITSHYMGAPLE